MNRIFTRIGFAIAIALVSRLAAADGPGIITDVHYSIFDSNQTSNLCFEVNGVFLAFSSNGSDEAHVIESLIVAAYISGRTVNVQSSSTAISPAPCQAWEAPASVYQVLSIAFQ